MKPITLTMQAFGSYGAKTVIDFTKPNQNLFLITGDTGSGKSTIFDAIAFALYGRASSAQNKKEGVELQSQYVECAVTPFVELTFSEKGQIYTVHRVPRHVRPLRKGKGIKEESESVSLLLPDGSEYSQNKKETNTHLEEIVGLTFGQFLQVAMIAQGEFMDLLRADSNRKKEIFQKLFHTEIYQNIVKELDQRRKSRLTDIARIRTACQTEIAHLDIPAEEPELQAMKDRICSAEKFNVADLEQLQERLGGLCESLSEAERTQAGEMQKASELRDREHERFSHASILKSAFDQLDQATQTLADCDAEQPELDALGKQIHEIRAAYEIQAVFERLTDAETTVSDTGQKLGAQKLLLPELRVAEQSAAEAEAEARGKKDEALQRYSAVSDRVQQALEVFQKLSDAEKSVSKKEKALETAQKTLETARNACEAFEKEVTEKQKRQAELQGAELALSRWEQQNGEVQALQTDLKAAETLQKAVSQQAEKADRLATAYAEVREIYLLKNDEYTHLRNAFLDAQAGFLAREKLRPGEPCPVCGSLEHPKPCALAEEHRELTREGMEALENELEQLDGKQNRAASEAGSAAEVLKEKQQTFVQALEKFRERLGRSTEVPPQAEFGELSEILTVFSESVAAQEAGLRENLEAYQEIVEFLQQAQEQSAALREAFERANTACADGKTALAAAEAIRDELRRQKQFESEAEAKSALSAEKILKNQAETAHTAANTALTEARSAREQAETRIAQYEEALPGQREQLALRQEAYGKILSDSGMEEAQWQSVTALHGKAEIAVMENRLQTARNRRATAEGVRKTALQTIGDQPRPVLEELQQAFDAAKERMEEVQAVQNRLSQQLRANRQVLEALSPRMEERSRITREFACIDHLYTRLAGKETGSRMDIETYVQRCYLRRILHAANLRFREMSAGQFELRMVPQEQAGEGKNRGLDLMVYSTVTGQEREVRTLSGGESFMAALSLALGMADQIQEKSASISLDMMFIDEGFGSLDTHSREQAVKVLQRMAGENRLIGIISHVTELKNSIEDQLLIRKDDQGSHARWVIS